METQTNTNETNTTTTTTASTEADASVSVHSVDTGENPTTETTTQLSEVVDSNEEVVEPQSVPQTAATATATATASPQSDQIDQGLAGTHPNQMQSPRIETMQGALAPAQQVRTTTVMPPFPPSESYKLILERLPNKSARIRRMHSDGYTTSQISKHLNILYQHARNVLMQIVKRPTEMQFIAPQTPPTPVIDINKLQEEAAKRNMSTDELISLFNSIKAA
jgi:hypothetical protein